MESGTGARGVLRPARAALRRRRAVLRTRRSAFLRGGRTLFCKRKVFLRGRKALFCVGKALFRKSQRQIPTNARQSDRRNGGSAGVWRDGGRGLPRSAERWNRENKLRTAFHKQLLKQSLHHQNDGPDFTAAAARQASVFRAGILLDSLESEFQTLPSSINDANCVVGKGSS